MRRARWARKDLTNAGSSQNQALDALRQGAQALADEAQQGSGQNRAAAGGSAGPQQLAPGQFRRQDSRRHRSGAGARRFWKNCAAAPRR